VEPRQLAAFVAVAEELHFGRAAERLGVAQPGVSQALRRLEARVGRPLVARSSRRVGLTGAGVAFLPHARAALAALAEADRAADLLARDEGAILRLATTPGVGPLLRELLAAFRARHPGIEVRLGRSGGASKREAVLAGELDAALVRDAPARPGIAHVPLEVDAWATLLAEGHPLAHRDRVDLGALAAHPLVFVGARRIRLQDALLAAARDRGLELRRGPEVGTLEDAVATVAASTAWTFLTLGAAAPLAPLGVVAVPLDAELPPAGTWLALRATDAPPAALALAAVARSHAAA